MGRTDGISADAVGNARKAINHNGRVDSVWTDLTLGSTSVYGLNLGSSARRPNVLTSRTNAADITYAYTKTGQVDTMFYPAIGANVRYRYDRRGRLDTLRATKASGRFFEQFLTYDAANRITKQRSVRNTTDTLKQDYTYDNLSQILTWNWTSPTSASQQTYAYDSVGNRVRLDEGFGFPAPPYEILTTGRTTASATDGPNQTVEIRKYLNPTTPNGKETNAYDPDGALTLTQTYNQNNALTLREKRRWSSWRGLPFRYRREQPQPMPPPLPWDTLRFEWEYRYNAMGEREQKREILHPGGATSSNPYTWTYYGLSGTNQQLSIWNGVETNAAVCGSPGLGSSWVWLAPTEYLTYGIENSGVHNDIPSVRTVPDGSGGAKEYRITDHLASLRTTLNASGAVTSTYDYEPFGDPLTGTPARQGFNGRERDTESEEFNNGVRKLDEEAGRFTSIDPLWEKFPDWSPYSYAENSPLVNVDPDGRQVGTIGPEDVWETNMDLPQLGGLPAVGRGLRIPSRSTSGVNQASSTTGGGKTSSGGGGTVSGGGGGKSATGSGGGGKKGGGGGGKNNDGGGKKGGEGKSGSSGENKPPLGKNPKDAGSRTNTDLPGGRAVARSIFKWLSKGKKFSTATTKNGGVRRTDSSGNQIRYNKDGSTRVDVHGRGTHGWETIHFNVNSPTH